MYIKPNVSKVEPAEKGAAGGVASLDNTGKAPSSQLSTMGIAAANPYKINLVLVSDYIENAKK